MKLSEIGMNSRDKSLEEIFDIEHKRVKNNIKDERTSAADKRKIKIELTYVPDSDRRLTAVHYSIKTDLAPIQGGATVIEILADGSDRTAVIGGNIPGQIDYRDLEPLSHDEDGVIIDD